MDIYEVLDKMRDLGYKVAPHYPHYDPNPEGYSYVIFGAENPVTVHNISPVNRKLLRVGLHIINVFHGCIATVEAIDDENNFTNRMARLRQNAQG